MRSNVFSLRSLPLMVASFLTVAAGTAAAQSLPRQTEYEGQFEQVTISSDQCEGIFSEANYQMKHFRAGPTYRTSVLHLASGDDAAFFNGISFFGLLGGSNDLYYEKDVLKDNTHYSIVAEGIIDVGFVLLDFTAKAYDDAGNLVCEASASLSGFN